jgi:hypothetical protein
MKNFKYFLLGMIWIGAITYSTAQQNRDYKYTFRMNLPAYLAGEVNGQFEFHLNNRLGLNVFSGVRSFDLFYGDFSNINPDFLTNYYTGLELRIFGVEYMDVGLIFTPYIKYSRNIGGPTSFFGWENDPFASSFTDQYLFMGMGMALRTELSDHMFIEVFGALGRGIYGVVRDQDGQQLFPNRSRFDFRIGALIGYMF